MFQLQPLNIHFSIVVFLLSLLLCITNPAIAREAKNKYELDWWQTAIVYQIYPRSFKDSDGDGIGDLKGIEEEVGHLTDIGVNCIWLSPVYQSPMADFGYDISDYKNIDSVFGTLDDFKSLVNTLQSLGIKIIMDFIPNHTSDEHEWFKKSVDKIEPYTNYYVWKDAEIIDDNRRTEPNNWKSVFNTSAWTWNETRGQYYLHQFHTKQPDLNYRNKKVVNDMKNNLRFWLDLGIDGYRIDAVGFLFEDDTFLDEPVKPEAFNEENVYDRYYHSYTMDLNETYDMVCQFREVLDEYKKKDGVTRILITEAYTTLEHTWKYYGDKQKQGAHLPFNFLLISELNKDSDANEFNTVVRKWLDNKPQDAWANWVIGNHDNPRVATRFGRGLVDGMNMLNLLLPGTAFTYMGEEIGMEDAKIIEDPTVDERTLPKNGSIYYRILSRDLARTPFQWKASKSSGFTFFSNTWLPANPNYWEINLDSQKRSHWSHYAVYKRLATLRKDPIIQRGDFNGHVLSQWVYVFSRSLPEVGTYLVVMNLGVQNETVTLSDLQIEQRDIWTVHTNSVNSEYLVGKELKKSGFRMKPKSALVLKQDASLFLSLSSLLTSQNRLDHRSSSF